MSFLSKLNKYQILFIASVILLSVAVILLLVKYDLPSRRTPQTPRARVNVNAPIKSKQDYDFLPKMSEKDRSFFLSIDKMNLQVSSDGKWLGFRLTPSPATPDLDAFVLYLLVPLGETYYRRFHYFTNIESKYFSFSPDGRYLATLRNYDEVVIFDLKDDCPIEVFKEKTQCKKEVCEGSVPGEGFTYKDRIITPVWKDGTTGGLGEFTQLFYRRMLTQIWH